MSDAEPVSELMKMDWNRADEFIGPDPTPCPTCGSTWEDGGQEWATDGGRLVPYGRCPECGWSCEPCPDIEDAFERSGD